VDRGLAPANKEAAPAHVKGRTRQEATGHLEIDDLGPQSPRRGAAADGATLRLGSITLRQAEQVPALIWSTGLTRC